MATFGGQWLDPLSFTKDEAEAMVGKRVVELTRGMDGKLVSGRRGEIVAADQLPEPIDNRYRYCVLVQWTDREGNRSRPRRYSKEELAHSTRPLRIQEIARQQHELNQELGLNVRPAVGRRRGLGL